MGNLPYINWLLRPGTTLRLIIGLYWDEGLILTSFKIRLGCLSLCDAFIWGSLDFAVIGHKWHRWKLLVRQLYSLTSRLKRHVLHMGLHEFYSDLCLILIIIGNLHLFIYNLKLPAAALDLWLAVFQAFVDLGHSLCICWDRYFTHFQISRETYDL